MTGKAKKSQPSPHRSIHPRINTSFPCLPTPSLDPQELRRRVASSNCPDDSFLNAVALARKSRKHIVVFNVGANTGFAVARALRRYGASNVTNRLWYKHILEATGGILNASGKRLVMSERLQLRHRLRGKCNEANDPDLPGASNLNVRVYAFELVPSTTELLQTVVNSAGISQLVNVSNIAMSDRPGMKRVSNATILASEFASLGKCHGCGAIDVGTSVPVHVETVDRMAQKLGLQWIDELLVDTEGFDALVLRGADSFLAMRRIGTIVFEYSHLWRDQGQRLKQVVEQLDRRSYNCFFLSRDFDGNMIPISGQCWRRDFEMYVWSNVA